jgi:hypothetical protein
MKLPVGRERAAKVKVGLYRGVVKARKRVASIWQNEKIDTKLNFSTERNSLQS